MAFRCDTVKLGPPRRLADGRLIAEATLTRGGILIYRNPDGSERRGTRDEATISGKALESLKLAPVTNAHPPVMVNAENAAQYVVGQVGQDVRRDGNHVIATLVINHASAVQEVETGRRRETSCGYKCDLDETPGVSPSGERFDARQVNVEYNHLAIVEAGRAGSARVHMDGQDPLFEIPSPSGAPTSAEATIPRADSKESPVDELQKALAKIAEITAERDAAKGRADASDAKAKDLELKLAAAESAKAAETARADAEKNRADEAVKARKDADDAFASKVEERAALRATAIEALGRNDKGEVLAADGKSTIDLAKMDDRAIRVAVVEKLDGVKIDDKRGAEAVAYAYELALDRAQKSGQALGAARAEIVVGRNDAANSGDAEAQAKARMKARLDNAAKGKETK